MSGLRMRDARARSAGDVSGRPARPGRPERATQVAVGALMAVGALLLSGCFPLSVSEPQPAQVEGTDFGAQQPNWTSCGDGMLCTSVRAPLDWADPEGEQITLALVKQEATSGESQGTLFVNPGGPGSSAVDYVRESIDYAVGEPLQEAFDVIGWDPRGVGASSAVECLDDAGMDEMLYGLGETEGLETGSDEWIAAAGHETSEYAAACLERTGPLLEFVDTQSTVHDLDMLREIVGDEQLNYLGYSYGTYIGARYADAYPEHVGRLVLDGAIDPLSTSADIVREQTRGFELSLRAYVTDCLTRAECPVSGPVDSAMAQWGALIDRVDAAPLVGSDGRYVTSDTLLTAIITPLYSQESWQYLDMLYSSVLQGDGDVALQLADFYNDRVDGVYESNLIPAFLAINCLDYPNDGTLDVESMRADAAELAEIAPTIGRYQGYGGVFCASWPFPGVSERAPVTAAGAAPILVIGTTGDPATPFRWAESLAAQLDSGVLLVFEGEGHTAYGNNSCVNEAVETYFLTGAAPDDGTRCQA